MSSNWQTHGPNFFVIGAPKSGTSALYSCLNQHPQIYMSPVKEPHFFTFEGEAPVFSGPKGAYFNRVAVCRPRDYLLLFSAVTGQHAIGEASTTYLNSPVAAKRINRFSSGARIIALLRQPADRAYSHYQYLRSQGVDPAPSFTEALAQESSRKKEGWFAGHLYRESGYYYEKLLSYFGLFPREQIKIYLYEDWNKTPSEVLRDLYYFLDVDDKFVPEIRRNNVTRAPVIPFLHELASRPERIVSKLEAVLPVPLVKKVIAGVQQLNYRFNLVSPPSLDPNIRRQLTDGYREDILKLQVLIDRDLSSWLV